MMNSLKSSSTSVGIDSKGVIDARQYIDQLEDEEKKKIKEIFDLFDKNLDGGIDIKELKFILNSKLIVYINQTALDINPNHDELTSMMYEADVSNKGYISKRQK